MTRLVMDTLFLDHLEFELTYRQHAYCGTAPSREEVLRRAMAEVGIELIDYGSFTQHINSAAAIGINVYSKAYRERMERDTAGR
jgi:hypothetical protein